MNKINSMTNNTKQNRHKNEEELEKHWQIFSDPLAGRCWPEGRMFDSPGLNKRP